MSGRGEGLKSEEPVGRKVPFSGVIVESEHSGSIRDILTFPAYSSQNSPVDMPPSKPSSLAALLVNS